MGLAVQHDGAQREQPLARAAVLAAEADEFAAHAALRREAGPESLDFGGRGEQVGHAHLARGDLLAAVAVQLHEGLVVLDDAAVGAAQDRHRDGAVVEGHREPLVLFAQALAGLLPGDVRGVGFPAGPVERPAHDGDREARAREPEQPVQVLVLPDAARRPRLHEEGVGDDERQGRRRERGPQAGEEARRHERQQEHDDEREVVRADRQAQAQGEERERGRAGVGNPARVPVENGPAAMHGQPFLGLCGVLPPPAKLGNQPS